MRYVIRLNRKAFNPLTRKIAPERLWEVEQSASKDSGPVFWHCAEVRIDGKSVRELFQLPKDGEAPWSVTVFGVCVRDYDDAVLITTRPADASGNFLADPK